MAAALTASFVLKLEDQLSNGIVALSKKLEGLARLARQVTMKGLDGADRALDQLGASATSAAGKVGRIGEAARRARADIQGLSEPIMVNAAGTAFLTGAWKRAAMAAGMAGALAAAGVGGPQRSAPFFPTLPGVPLLLAGPGGSEGGIPLAALNVGRMRMTAMAEQAAAFHAELRGAALRVREVGDGLTHVAHAGIAAFATGFGLMHPISEYADYEDRVRHIGITTGATKEQLPGFIGGHMQEYDKLGIDTAQPAKQIADAAMFLLTDGLSKATVDAILPSISKAATAYRGSVPDGVAAAFTMHQNLKVPEADMQQAIAMMALAGRSGHVTFADQSRLLQGLAPAAERAGMTGLGGAAKLLAMLEAVKRGGAGTSDQAAVMLKDMIDYFNSPFGAHSFAKGGIDLPRMLVDAEKKGINPVEAVMAAVQRHTAGMTKQQQANYLGTVMHNSEARQALAALLNQDTYRQDVERKLRSASPSTINEDFDKAQGPEVKLRLLEERLAQIVRRFGQGFAVLLDPMNAVLDRLLAGFAWMDAHMPGVLDKILGWGGGFLVLATALGVLIPLFKVFAGGLGLIMTGITLLGTVIRILATTFAAATIAGGPLLWAILAIAGAAALIYANWDRVGPWFRALWEAIKGAFTWFVGWIDGWTGGAVTAAVEKIRAAWGALKEFFWELVNNWREPFENFFAYIDRKILALRNSTIGKALGVSTDDKDLAPSTRRDRDIGYDLPAPQRIKVDITAGVDPNNNTIKFTNITTNGAETSQTMNVPNAGEMAGRD